MVNFNDVTLDVSTGYVKIHKPEKVQIDPSEIVWEDEEHEGFRIIKNIEGKYNYIDRSYFLLSPYQDFVSCARFNEGFAAIYIEGKGVNFISRNGNYLSREWYDYAKPFQDGYGIVGIKGKGETYIDVHGKLPFKKKWFQQCCSFNNGFARIFKKDKGWNFINTRGK